MTTAAPSTALAEFLAGYRGLTREAYTLDLRQFASWCRSRSLALFAVRRADIEGFARDPETKGRARATVTRRLSTIRGFYKYAVQKELLDRSTAGSCTGQCGSRIGAAQVELTSLAGAAADLPGQKVLHIGGGHESQRCAAQVELGHARHIQHGLGSQDMAVKGRRLGLVGDVQDELRSFHASTLPLLRSR